MQKEEALEIKDYDPGKVFITDRSIFSSATSKNI